MQPPKNKKFYLHLYLRECLILGIIKRPHLLVKPWYAHMRAKEKPNLTLNSLHWNQQYTYTCKIFIQSQNF